MAEVIIDLSEEELKKIYKRLEAIPGKQNLILKMSVNEAAKKVKSKIAKETSKRYATKERKAYLQEMEITNATSSYKVAEITAKTKTDGNLFDFKLSPRDFLTGEGRPKYFKGRVLRKSSIKNLSEDGFKAFVIKFSFERDGKKGETLKVVRRTSKKKRSVKKVIAPSVVQMLNTTAGLPEIQKESQQILRECMEKHIQKALGGKW